MAVARLAVVLVQVLKEVRISMVVVEGQWP